jgi:hypothetical protein
LLGQGAVANDNRAPAEVLDLTREAGELHGTPEPTINPFTQHALELFGRSGYSEPADRSPSRNVLDAAAAGIGAAIEFGVRFMDGIIACPSPREQAIAKAWAIREHHLAPEREAAAHHEQQQNDFLRHALTAVREAQAEHDRDRERDFEERGRSRERNR